MISPGFELKSSRTGGQQLTAEPKKLVLNARFFMPFNCAADIPLLMIENRLLNMSEYAEYEYGLYGERVPIAVFCVGKSRHFIIVIS